MANENTHPPSSKRLADVLHFLSNADLDATFVEFCRVTGAPPSLRCLELVAQNVRAFFENCSPSWREIPCFASWPCLLEFILKNRNRIAKLIDEQVSPKPRVVPSVSTQVRRNPMRGEITIYPIFAMLCDVHELPSLRLNYAALQMQFLFASWLELDRAQRLRDDSMMHPSSSDKAGAIVGCKIRDPGPYARAIRDLSNDAFSPLLEYLSPMSSPESFRKHLREQLPYFGADYSSQFIRIREFCDKRHDGRDGGERRYSKRDSPRRPHPEIIPFNDWLLGIPVQPSAESEPEIASYELLVGHSLAIDEAVRLGLAPEELTGSEVVVSADVSDAEDRYEALARVRDQVRGFEIERRLFPWNSEALRLEEMHIDILPALQNATLDGSLSEESLAGAVLNAIIIETGREIDEALSIEVVKSPQAKFCFQLPTQGDPFGYWSWPAIGPDYAVELYVPADLESRRASLLRYLSSPLLTSLIKQLCLRSRIRTGKLFRKDLDYKKLAQDWLSAHNPRKRLTFTRLAHLVWDLLHEATGGDLVTACLTLGVRRQNASVQLHYAVVERGEARRLFEETSKRLWKSEDSPAFSTDSITDSLLVGCRAFPNLERVREIVGWLRTGSMSFFAINASEFNPEGHRDLLNRAVLYLIWHQFFSFGTRAIRDAYQDLSNFAPSTGIGVMSDKDFADGYKTRVIWADDN